MREASTILLSAVQTPYVNFVPPASGLNIVQVLD